MDEQEKKLRQELEKYLDTLRRNLAVVSKEELKTKYKKPYQELKDNICKAATAYTRHIALGGILIKQKYDEEVNRYVSEVSKSTQCLTKSPKPHLSGRTWMRLQYWQGSFVRRLSNTCMYFTCST